MNKFGFGKSSMKMSCFTLNMILLSGIVMLFATEVSAQTAAVKGPAEIPIPKSQQDWTGPLGIAARKPVYAGGCKECPFGEMGIVTREALSHYGYDVHLCYTCATALAAKDMSFKENRQQEMGDPYNPTRLLVESTPPTVPDIATGHDALMARLLRGQNESGNPDSAAEPPLRNNLRLIANVLTPSWYVIAVRRSLGITTLAQLRNRRGIWIFNGAGSGPVLKYYGLTLQVLQKNGGGYISGAGRERRAGADVWIGDLASLTHTVENRMWGEITELNDLIFLQMDEGLLNQLVATTDYERTIMPMGTFRGQDEPVPTVSRIGGTFVYVRDEAPDDFAYTLARALYEHRDLFRKQLTVFYYDPETVVKSVLPLHPGAAKFYREIGFLR